MNKEILDILPHSAIEELINLRELVTKLASNNLNFVILEPYEIENVQYKFTEIISGYEFIINEFSYNPNGMNCTYVIHKRPESTLNMAGHSFPIKFENIAEAFRGWVSDCTRMNEIKYKFKNPNCEFYEKEFEDFFSNNDNDASEHPFEINRQEIIFYFLTYTEIKVNNSVDINEETKYKLLEEISVLKDDLPNVTKKEVVHRMSKFAEKVKKVSNKLFHDIFDVLKKELIKKVLLEGAEQLPSAVTKIEHWLSLLG